MTHIVVDRKTGEMVYIGSFEECEIYVAKHGYNRYAIKLEQ